MINFDYLYDKSYYGNELAVNHRKDDNLHWKVIPGGIILPHDERHNGICGGIIDKNREYIDGSGLHRGMEQDYDVTEEEIGECDEDIVFLGVWASFVWGHCLTDNIRRLWVLDNEEFMEKYGHLRFIYVPSFNVDPDGNFNQLLEILGVDVIQLESISEVTRFRNIILPDECFWREDDGARFFTGNMLHW